MSNISKTIRLGGDLEVNRLGFGAMRIVGKGVWGEPEDAAEATRVLQRAVELMTTWKDSDNAESMIELVSNDLGLALAEGRLIEDAGELIAGLMALAATFLAELEHVTGESMSAILQTVGWLAAGNEPPTP